MFPSRLTIEYKNGVEEFIKFTIEHADNPIRIKYPCIRCGCLNKVIIVLRDYLIINRIDQTYTR